MAMLTAMSFSSRPPDTVHVTVPSSALFFTATPLVEAKSPMLMARISVPSLSRRTGSPVFTSE